MPKIKNDVAVPKPKKAVYTDTYFSLPFASNLSFKIWRPGIYVPAKPAPTMLHISRAE